MARKKKKVMKLNADNIEKIHNKLSKQVEARIENEHGFFEFKYDVFFLKSKILRLVRDLAILSREMHRKVPSEYEEATFHSVVGCLIMKYFTDIDVPDSFEAQVSFASKLLDLKLFNEILQHFPDEELGKVYEEAVNVIKMWGDKKEVIIEKIKELEEQIENEEVKELLPRPYIEENDDVAETQEEGKKDDHSGE